MLFRTLNSNTRHSPPPNTVQAAPSDKVDCSKVDEVLDDLGSVQGMTTLNDKYKLSKTPEDLQKRCTEANEAIKTLRKYNKECFSSLTQQVLSAILRTRAQFNELYCKDSAPEYKAGLEAAKCIAENAFANVNAAEKGVILKFQAIVDANIPDDKMRTRRACCSVLETKKLFLEAIKEKCSTSEKVYSDYVDSYTSEAMGLICVEPEKLDCKSLEPLKTEGVESKSKFFLGPIVKVVKTLDH